VVHVGVAQGMECTFAGVFIKLPLTTVQPMTILLTLFVVTAAS